MIKDAFYFKHDCNARNDEKLLSVRRKYGMEGYGVYWALVEKMRESKDYQIKKDYNDIAWDLRVGEDIIKSVVEDFNLFSVKGDKIYSRRLMEDMKAWDKKKENMAERGKKMAQARWEKNEEKCIEAPQQEPLLKISGKEKETLQPTKKLRQKKYSDAETELHSKCKAAFSDIYRQAKGEDFVWSAKEMSGLVGVIADVKVKMKSKGFDIDNNDTVADNFAQFVNLIFMRADDWTKRNATPTLIHSKFNEIYTTIANNTANGNKQTATSANGIRAIYNSEFLARIAKGLQSDEAE